MRLLLDYEEERKDDGRGILSRIAACGRQITAHPAGRPEIPLRVASVRFFRWIFSLPCCLEKISSRSFHFSRPVRLFPLSAAVPPEASTKPTREKPMKKDSSKNAKK